MKTFEAFVNYYLAELTNVYSFCIDLNDYSESETLSE